MAAFVKSVEEVTVSFTSTTGLQLQTAALTKSQDPAKCVPFITARFTSTGSPRVTRNNLVSVEIVDDGGTPTVEARRNGQSTVGALTCVIYIVEFADAVTVQKGTLTKSGTSATAAISSVNQGNSFLAFNYHAGAGSAGASSEVATALGFFASNTQIEFNRAFRTDYDLEIAWYVVESNGTDFNVEYIEYNYGSSETGPTNVALSNSVSLGNSFIVPNFELFDYTDRVRDWAFNWALTGTSQITFYRNSGTPNRSGTAGVFVVRSNAAGVNTQRLDTDVGSTPTTNETVTAVDTDKAVLIAGGHVSSFSTFSPTSDIAGNDLWRHSTTLDLTSTTNVQLQRNSQDLAGPNNIARYELVEFEIAAGIEYTLAADQGSFAFSGLDAKTVTETQLSAEQGSFGYTGLDATLGTGQALVAETGAFGFTGLDAKTVFDLRVTAETGTFGFSGLDATLSVGQPLEAETGVYGYAGLDAKLVVDYRPSAETGSYDFTGLPADFRITDQNTLPAGAGGYAFDGQMANFYYGYALKAETGAFAFKGLPVQFPGEEVEAAGLPILRKPKVKKRRYILPDNRVFEDAERALFELRRLLLSERQEQTESDGSEVQPVVLETTGAALEDLPSDYLGPTLMDQVLQELPALVEARPANLDPIDPQLLSVLLQRIDDEEAAMLLL